MSVDLRAVAKRAVRSVRRRAERAAKSFAPRGLILVYHRVAELSTDPQWLAVPPNVFAEHLEVVKRGGQVASLTQLLGAIGRGRMPRRAIAVTFDDGYLDNLRNAKPLLERHGVPATVFVTSGRPEGAEAFFWDELDRLLLRGGPLPEALRVTIGQSERVWELGVSAASSGWNVSHPPGGAAERAYAELCPLIKPLPDGQRAAVMDQVRRQLQNLPENPAGQMMMAPEQWRELTAGALVEIGAHTVTHPMLSQLSPEEQEKELRVSKRVLEERLGRPVSTMAYPFGGRADYTETTVRLAREAGYEAACSNFPALVDKSTDLYQLPRILVRDWPAHELERRITEWFRG